MNPIQLSRPPIREAVLDFRVEGNVNVEDLRQLAENYGREHGLTKITPIRAGLFGFSISPGQPFTTHAKDEGVIGLRVEDDPATRIVQFRVNGFTFSLTEPYDNWASFRDRALVPTRRFLSCKGIDRIVRIALRYINVIRFSESRVDLDEYLPAAPKIPAALPQAIGGVFSRILLPLPEDDLKAIITQTLEEPPDPTPSVILDIDVFQQVTLHPSDTSWEKTLEKIRDWKNRIFLNTSTTKP